MNIRSLEKSIRVLEKSWKFVSEKGRNPGVGVSSVLAQIAIIHYHNKGLQIHLGILMFLFGLTGEYCQHSCLYCMSPSQA